MYLLKPKSRLMRYEALMWEFIAGKAKGTCGGFSQTSDPSDIKYAGPQLEPCSACVF